MRLRRDCRVDGNHLEICHTLRKCGVSIRSTASLGDGFPDVVAGFRGFNYLIEIKNGAKKWNLSKDQVVFHDEWQGQIVIIDSIESAIEWMNGFRHV